MARHWFRVAAVRRWTRAAVALAGAAVVVTAAPAVADGGHVSGALAFVNGSRSASGSPPVSLDPGLSSIAHGWAVTLAQRDELVHNARLPAALEDAFGSGWVSAGENLGRGPNVTSIHDGFLASASHRAVLLDPAYTLVGIAVVPNGQRLLTVHVFVHPAAPAPAAVTPAADPPGGAPPPSRSGGDTVAAARPAVHPLAGLAATNRAPPTQVRDHVPRLRSRAVSAARAGTVGALPAAARPPDRSRAVPASVQPRS
ncbi:MAG: CAP domain-containing protein [Actinobacteria bacterium]|nr:CAP domain-containing protein [Actinomycetota bacterium]